QEPLLLIERDGLEVLSKSGIAFEAEQFQESRDGDLLVRQVLSEYATGYSGKLFMAIFNWAVQAISLASVSLGVLENASNDPSNVARRDRGEATVLVIGRHISAVAD